MQWTSAPNIGEAPLPQRARSYWKTRFSTAHEGLENLLEAERAQLPPWFVVGFGTGIAAWFALGSDWQWKLFLSLAAACAAAGFAIGGGRAGRALGWFALASTIGCGEDGTVDTSVLVGIRVGTVRSFYAAGGGPS